MGRKRITKTHIQATIENEIDADCICPHCGEETLGGISCREEIGGLFFSKTKYYSKYSCMYCGTEWEVDD